MANSEPTVLPKPSLAPVVFLSSQPGHESIMVRL